MNKAFRNTIRDFFNDQALIIFMILVPLFYPLLYAWIYNNETIQDVPVVVVDADQSSRSRDFVRRLDATEGVRVVGQVSALDEADRLISQGEVRGVVLFPADFAAQLARQEQAHVSVMVDASGMLYYKAVLTAATDVSLAMNADIKVERAHNMTQREDAITQHPLRYEQIALFNPQGGFSSFLIPAVLILVIHQTLLLGIGMEAGTRRERMERTQRFPTTEEFTLDDKAAMLERQTERKATQIAQSLTERPSTSGDRHPRQPRAHHASRRAWRQLLGRAAAFTLIYVPVACYCLLVVPRLFSLPTMGDVWSILLFATPFLLAVVFLGITIGHFARQRESIVLIVVFSSMPLLFLSGVSWPGTAFPWYWKTLSYFLPSTFGVNGFVRLSSMGATLAEVQPEYIALWIQVVGYGLTAWWVTRRNELRKIALRG